MNTEDPLARRFLAAQQAIEIQELGNLYWIPRRENPAGGLAKLKSDLLPLLRHMETGSYNPGHLRPLQGVAIREPYFVFTCLFRAFFFARSALAFPCYCLWNSLHVAFGWRRGNTATS